MARQEDKLRCTKEPFMEDFGPRKIKSIRFSTFSGDEIRKSAEVQVWNSKFYDTNVKPVEHGLLDLRMGPASKMGFCATCHGNFTDCPGHFGFLKLTLPVFNIGYFSSILNILKCICKSCARVLLPEKVYKEYLKKMRNPRADILLKNAYAKAIRDKCKASRCVRCGYINGVVKKGQSSLGIIQDFTKIHDESLEEFHSALSHIKDNERFRKTHVLSPDKVLNLFKRMVEEDCEVLHLSDRPEKLIVTDIAVPPVAIRPSVFVDSKSSNEDSITNMLRNIINTNSILREDLESAAPAFKCLDCWASLQAQVAEYVNSEAPGVTDSKNRGFVQRLKGKQGRFRGNLSGKRTEFTGRTVISPDPNLKITEARVMPWRTLRFNESVCNPYNADFDGDEMNLHVPQTEEARTEALMLMGTSVLPTSFTFFLSPLALLLSLISLPTLSPSLLRHSLSPPLVCLCAKKGRGPPPLPATPPPSRGPPSRDPGHTDASSPHPHVGCPTPIRHSRRSPPLFLASTAIFPHCTVLTPLRLALPDHERPCRRLLSTLHHNPFFPSPSRSPLFAPQSHALLSVEARHRSFNGRAESASLRKPALHLLCRASTPSVTTAHLAAATALAIAAPRHCFASFPPPPSSVSHVTRAHCPVRQCPCNLRESLAPPCDWEGLFLYFHMHKISPQGGLHALKTTITTIPRRGLLRAPKGSLGPLSGFSK
ncbi:hypothetical protein Taro_035314 [Colocasia esculenta]|uniref:DNA-directed RNA polymerase subunit n=1 Tax=Colocasia esculenta TaxID=4460 RepID=A0A843WCV4_COLES|nr:hypothetical protein [Colocasia esculenta]